jgi:hypothetical protein
MKRGKGHRDLRREEAESRQVLRSHRSPEEQLALLDEKLGPGAGATRERARLQKMIAARSDKSQQKTAKTKPKTRASRRAEKNKRKQQQNS